MTRTLALGAALLAAAGCAHDPLASREGDEEWTRQRDVLPERQTLREQREEGNLDEVRAEASEARAVRQKEIVEFAEDRLVYQRARRLWTRRSAADEEWDQFGVSPSVRRAKREKTLRDLQQPEQPVAVTPEQPGKPTPEGEPPPPAVEESAWRISPTLVSSLFVHADSPGDDPRQILAELWLKLQVQALESLKGRLTLVGDIFHRQLGEKDDRVMDPVLQEAFLEFAKSGFEVRAGLQVIPWGNADGYNPTDVLTSKDYRMFFSDEERRRRGAPSLKLSWTPESGASPFTMSVVWAPLVATSRILVPPGVLPEGMEIGEAGQPDFRAENTEFAARLTFVGSGWDASLVGFSGYNSLPQYALGTDPAGPPIASRLRRLWAAGGEASLTVKDFILRLEGAYHFTEDDKGDVSFQPSNLDLVAGVERPFFDSRLRIQAQVTWRYYPNWVDPDTATGATPEVTPVVQALAKANAMLLDFQDQNRLGSTLRIAFTTQDQDFEIATLGIVHWFGGDYLLRQTISYQFIEGIRALVGVDFYDGPDGRLFGALRKDYRSIYLEAKISY